MLSTNHWGQQNPLIRRVRRHASFATLFRASMPGTAPSRPDPNQPVLGRLNVQPGPSSTAVDDAMFHNATSDHWPQAVEQPRVEMPTDAQVPVQPAFVQRQAIPLPAAAPSASAQAPNPLRMSPAAARVQPASPISSQPTAAFSAQTVDEVGTAMTSGAASPDLGMPSATTLPTPLPGPVGTPSSVPQPMPPSSQPSIQAAVQRAQPTAQVATLVRQPIGEAGTPQPVAESVMPASRLPIAASVTPTVASPTPSLGRQPPLPQSPAEPAVQRQTTPEPPADGIDDATWSRLQTAYQKYKARELGGESPSASLEGRAQASQPAPSPLVQRQTADTPPRRRTVIVEQTAEPSSDAASAMVAQPAAGSTQPILEQGNLVGAAAAVDSPPAPTGSSSSISDTNAAGLEKVTSATGNLALNRSTATSVTTPGETELMPGLAGGSDQVANLADAEMLQREVDADALSTTPPLHEVWPVQRFATPDEIALAASEGLQATSNDGQAPNTMIEPVPELDSRVREQLALVHTARPTDSSVDIVVPRRPRPQLRQAVPLSHLPSQPAGVVPSDQPSTVASVAASTVPTVVQAAPLETSPGSVNAQPQARQPASSNLEATTLIPTEIGPLPADLWTLIGEEAPRLAKTPPARNLPDARPQPTQQVIQPMLEQAEAGADNPLTRVGVAANMASADRETTMQQGEPNRQVAGKVEIVSPAPEAVISAEQSTTALAASDFIAPPVEAQTSFVAQPVEYNASNSRQASVTLPPVPAQPARQASQATTIQRRTEPVSAPVEPVTEAVPGHDTPVASEGKKKRQKQSTRTS